MSAFIVSNQHIDYMISAAFRLVTHANDNYQGFVLSWYKKKNGTEERQTLSLVNRNDVGQMLLRENHKSVQFRYNENPKIELNEPYRWIPTKKPITHAQVFKAIECYIYQSCEHPGFYESEAFAFCEALRKLTIHTLPGYESAEWEIRST